MNFLNRILSFLSSFIKRSFKTHGTISVADLERSNAFYRQLGFRRVMSSRGDEVVLLRNHLGDELNLVKRAGERVTVAFESESLVDLQALTALNPQVSQDGLGPRVGFTDPDGNNVEFYQVNSNLNRPVKSVFHIATREEVLSGLSEHCPSECHHMHCLSVGLSGLLSDCPCHCPSWPFARNNQASCPVQ